MEDTNSISIITQNGSMRAIIDRLRHISDSDTNVLLIGETGVGKEIFAEYIHRTSMRSNRPFVKIGLSSLPEDLMASELFGHEKGSFTGAVGSKKGLFEMADSGSIFLDDIDDVPLSIQTKLLRVLESRELMRVGGVQPIPVDIRLISASKVELKDMVDRNLFRSDLFYRINVLPVYIPPLRERRDDIPLLVEYFLKRYAPGKDLEVTMEAMKALVNYHWPGNVRELRNVVQRASLFTEKRIGLGELPDDITGSSYLKSIVKACSLCFHDEQMQFSQVVGCVESNLIKEALRQADGNQSEAAKMLNLSLSTFRDKLKKYQDKNFLTCD
jgi:transcriptional regulator with PAS, ATPase and Fis domain